MKLLPVLLCCCMAGNVWCQKQKVDSVIDKGIYQSFFSSTFREPLYVTYILYKGGGVCDRENEGFDFKVDKCRDCARADDYTNHGFEKGHLANAEDFAFDCTSEELTFRFYNCVPQTTALNHGAWLDWEGKIRELSKKQKLFIVAGSIFGKQTIGNGKVRVPTYCYKIVLNNKSKKLLQCLLFPNDASGSVQAITLAKLKKKMNYDLMPAGYWKKVK